MTIAKLEKFISGKGLPLGFTYRELEIEFMKEFIPPIMEKYEGNQARTANALGS